VVRPFAPSEGTCPILEGRPASDEQGGLFDFDPHAVARAFALALVKDDDETLKALTVDTMRPEALDALVANFDLPFGEFLGADEPTMGFLPSPDILELRLPLIFRSGRLALTVSIRSDCQVAGATIRAGFDPATVPYKRPAYVDLDRFDERAVVVGRPPWALGGTLAMPHGPGPFPAIVLVPGSGYSDRDASDGPNAIRRDLAWGLASSGVASLRYDKRTLTHALAFARLPAYTLDDELVDDALAAVALLRRTPGIDPARIYVRGGSLGGSAAPRIGARDPGVAGLVIFSGASQPDFEGLVARTLRAAERDGVVSDIEHQAILLTLLRQSALDGLVRGDEISPFPYLRPSYWLDLREYRPPLTAGELDMPLLILHGLRDEVLTVADVEGWSDALIEREKVAFRGYRTYVHVLADERELVRLAENFVEAHVAADVISDIVAWIAGEFPARLCQDLESWYAGCHGGPGARVGP
jgi:dienelactone hydrolase